MRESLGGSDIAHTVMHRSVVRASINTAIILAGVGLLLGVIILGPFEFTFRSVAAAALAGVVFALTLVAPSRTIRRSSSAVAKNLVWAASGGLGGLVWAIAMNHLLLPAIIVGAIVTTLWMALETRGFA